MGYYFGILTGPPGPNGIPSKYQAITNNVHTTPNAKVYGIKLESREPSFIFYHTFARKIERVAYKASSE